MPVALIKKENEHMLEQWHAAALDTSDPELSSWMLEAENPEHNAHAVLISVCNHSPYLSRLLIMYPALFRQVSEQSADAALAAIMADMRSGQDIPAIKKKLRIAKGKLALVTALADIGGWWPLEKVTTALSEFAERSVALALDALLQSAHQRGDIVLPHAETPSRNSGIVLLAMGKLGGHELNYSSDIDVMLFYEPGRLSYQGRHNEQHFMNGLAHDLVEILQERTPDGYVFRTDLRLRPDPASMPPAISIDAAHHYYESVGQNWERAAMIKACPIAGDMDAAAKFMKNIAPFMWRRNLDFASIQDIHSIKRQMDARQNKEIQVKGHHIKLGIGGIREIEFFVQIHQLIWGGREPSLRLRGTCEALDKLVELKLIKPETSQTLKAAYVFLRTLEHRLQMVNDEQTHELPETDEGVAAMAEFMGYSSTEAFEQALLEHLHAVHDIYSVSFKSSEKLGDVGNLVFTGVTHDPDTLATLKEMGFANPETISERIMGWHHGAARATRSKRARELLTELKPVLLKKLSETAHPDAAFIKFDNFLRGLPSGVQLFSLFQANPQLLSLITDILGSAPLLAEYLSKTPSLLDAVLYDDFYGPLPNVDELWRQWRETSKHVHDFEDRIHLLTRFRNEKQFQAGVQLLKHMVTAQQTGQFLADIADIVIQEVLKTVEEEFARTYGKIKGGAFAVMALGKLGSCEMTFSSDIDLVFIYDAPDINAMSTGEKTLSATVYYNRLSQRLVTVLSTLSREGRLYEVDTRLRPSGTQSLLATNVDGLEQYFDQSAWTFEYMAFTKARSIAGPEKLKEALRMFVVQRLTKQRDTEKLRADVIDMRERMDKEFGTKNPWDIKYARGGLVDIDFIAQYLLLKYAPEYGNAVPGGATVVFEWLKQKGALTQDIAKSLTEADRFLGQMFNMLRLCADQEFKEESALPGFKKILCQSAHMRDFEAMHQHLIEVERTVYAFYNSLIDL